jgi:hypothetical protein
MSRSHFKFFCLAFLLPILAGVPFGPSAVADQAEPAAPILRVETGMHSAVINRVALDEANKRFVTVSDDKTTRLWSLADGSLTRVFRTDVGTGDLGAVLAVALHGDMLITGTRNLTEGGTLNIFDLKTGTLRGARSYATPISASCWRSVCRAKAALPSSTSPATRSRVTMPAIKRPSTGSPLPRTAPSPRHPKMARSGCSIQT